MMFIDIVLICCVLFKFESIYFCGLVGLIQCRPLAKEAQCPVNNEAV